jgi:hypothetical protein
MAKIASNVFSVIAGSDIFVLGRLTPFRLQFTTLYHSWQLLVFLSVSTISNISFPSSNKILSPVFTSLESFIFHEHF